MITINLKDEQFVFEKDGNAKAVSKISNIDVVTNYKIPMQELDKRVLTDMVVQLLVDDEGITDDALYVLRYDKENIELGRKHDLILQKVKCISRGELKNQ